MPSANPATSDEADVKVTLSTARLSTYETACNGDTRHALSLYGWNARMSAALILPAHFAEVATRNAVDQALTALYGPRWPWDTTFELSLPTPTTGYNPRSDLRRTRSQQPTTGKVIAELKFVFWQKMFTARHQTRVWDPHIRALFPQAPQGGSAASLRQRIYDDLEVIRRLRNRLAHHEPIFTRMLSHDLAMMLDLVELRSAGTAGWVRAMEEASALLLEHP